MNPAADRRRQLLDMLATLNGALYRQGAAPLITPTEAQTARLPDDNLSALVALTADRIVAVARATNGLP